MLRIISTLVLLLLPLSQGCATVVRPGHFEFPGTLELEEDTQMLKYNNINGLVVVTEPGVPITFNINAEGAWTLSTPGIEPVQVHPLPLGSMKPLTMEQITTLFADIPAIAEALDQGETNLDVLNQHYFAWEHNLQEEYWQCMLLFADQVAEDWDTNDPVAMAEVELAINQVVTRVSQHEFISNAVAAPSMEYVTVYLTAGPEEFTNVGMFPLSRLPDLEEAEPLTEQQYENLYFSIQNLLRTDPYANIILDTGFIAYPNP